jgi:hypothetical protein
VNSRATSHLKVLLQAPDHLDHPLAQVSTICTTLQGKKTATLSTPARQEAAREADGDDVVVAKALSTAVAQSACLTHPPHWQHAAAAGTSSATGRP